MTLFAFHADLFRTVITDLCAMCCTLCAIWPSLHAVRLLPYATWHWSQAICSVLNVYAICYVKRPVCYHYQFETAGIAAVCSIDKSTNNQQPLLTVSSLPHENEDAHTVDRFFCLSWQLGRHHSHKGSSSTNSSHWLHIVTVSTSRHRALGVHLLVTIRSWSSLQRISGLEATSMEPSACRYAM